MTYLKRCVSNGRDVVYLFAIVLLCWRAEVQADVKLPAMFSDHAVLQRDVKVPVWGWAAPGEQVKVVIPGQEHATKADASGQWQVTLDPLTVGKAFSMIVEGKNRIEVKDVQVGDVWLCSGQSNMGLDVARARDADLEIPAADYPYMRLITVATEGGQTPQQDFDGHWQRCTPESIGDFSAVGYYFGRDMYQNLKVPIGLIDNSWGGSACEAWVRRDLMEGNPLYEPLLKRWDKMAANFDETKARANFQRRLADWQEKARVARREGKPAPPKRPNWKNPLTGNHRPANLYNGRICPVMPYAIRGAIWYQGESNASRAYEYREMFPLMIKNWRDDWGQGNFPFFWVQLADFMPEQNEPGDSAWAELREAQTMALDKTPSSGQAVIIDVGEANDIHPKDKQTVGRRLARLALADVFDRKNAHDSPRYESMEKQGDSIVIRLRDVNGRLRTVDGKPVEGFAIAGADRKWAWADAAIVGGDEINVHSDAVPEPVAVRYAWADNPVCNLYDTAGLPVTPFRTDDWPGVTANAQ